jgi:hypothetical protein
MYSCISHGKKEKCLLKGGKYPVTKDGKLSGKRVRAADAYGSRFGVISKLKKAGLCKVAKQKKIKLKTCSKK